MRNTVLLVISFFLYLLYGMKVLAQEKTLTAEEIKNSPDYVYGEGMAGTDADADQAALANLISQISVDVSSSFDVTTTELKQNGQSNTQERVSSVLSTYSANMLTNTKCLYLSHEPEARVLRYIKVAEINNLFNERTNRVLDLVRDAQTMTNKGRIDDALRYYYWAFCLLKSLQHPNQVCYQEHRLIDWIPQQMDDLFRNISVKVAGREDNVIDIYVTYMDKPVTSLEFRFMNGQNYSYPCSIQNGIGQIEFRPGVDPERIQIRYEYEYSSQDKEVEMVTRTFQGTPFPKATCFVNYNKKDISKAKLSLQQQVKSAGDAISSLDLGKAKDYLPIMEDVVKAIRTKRYESVKKYFTDAGYGMFDSLVRYGNATLVGQPSYSFYEMYDKVVCRSIPMQFAFKNNRRTFHEDVTFTFNKDKRIESLAFALDQTARNDIFMKEAWPDSIRMVIATFLENYQTAFALKRLDYIESIFSDDALIIIGHVVKRAPKTIENSKYINNEIVKYTRQDKRTYIRNLQNCFRSNEFINLRLTDNEVLKLAKEHGECYGILIHQDYYSSSYSDTGYLCLLVDFNDAKNPTIIVRTWQPKRDSSLSHHLPRNHKYWGLLTPHSL